VLHVIISQPYVVAESVKVQTRLKTLRRLIKRSVLATIQMKYVTLHDEQLMTLRLSSGNYLHFQPDTGAQCNIIPVQLYRKAANDPDLKEVKPSNSTLGIWRFPTSGHWKSPPLMVSRLSISTVFSCSVMVPDGGCRSQGCQGFPGVRLRYSQSLHPSWHEPQTSSIVDEFNVVENVVLA